MDDIRSEELAALNSNVTTVDSNATSVVASTDNTCLILHPFGIYRTIWDIFVMIILIYTFVEVPFTLAFDITLTLNTISGIIALLIDLSLLIDIYVNFRTAFFDKYDPFELITQPSEIAKQYLKTWFLLDLFTSIPFEFLLANEHNDIEAMRAIKMLRLFRFFRMMKLLRFCRMMKAFNNLLNNIFSSRSFVTILKLFRIICLMMLIAHFTACVWWISGRESLKYFDESWIANDQLNMLDSDEVTVAQQYIKSFYFAVVTLFTTGFGDITPMNTAEEIVGSFVIILGTIFFAYFIGSVSNLINEDDRIRCAQIQKMEEAQAFCSTKKLPKSLSIQVLTHLKYYWATNACDASLIDDEQIMKHLPQQIQTSIASHCDKQCFIDKLSIFKNLSTYIRGLIALKLKSISCSSDTYLFKEEQFGQKLFIQRTGTSMITSSATKCSHKSERGTVCGYFSFIKPQRETSLKTLSYSEFWELDYCDLQTILQKTFPPNKWQNICDLIKDNIKTLYDKQQIYLNVETATNDTKTRSEFVQCLNINNDQNIRDQNVRKTAKKIKGSLDYQTKEMDFVQKPRIILSTCATNSNKKEKEIKKVEEETKMNVADNNMQLLCVPVAKQRKKVKKRILHIEDNKDDDEDSSSSCSNSNSNSMFGENSLNSLSKSIPMNVATNNKTPTYTLIESQTDET